MTRFFFTMVRRTASLSAMVCVAVVTALAQGSGAGWAVGLGAAALIALLVAAATPDRWLRSEGEWLGTVPASRWRLLACAWLGVAAGAAALLGVVLLVAYLSSPTASPEGDPGDQRTLTAGMELAAVAGPRRSLVLLPGESLEQTLASFDRPMDRAAALRIHCTVTLGGSAPVTIARAVAGPATRSEIIARRTWVEIPLDRGAHSVRVTNIGEGALAVLGPNPIEVWVPSRAHFGGHPRVWAHGSLWLATLTSLALFFGVLMGPGVAAVFAFAVWLGAGMLAGAFWPGSTPSLPGGPALGSALETVVGGRTPLPPAPSTLLAAAGCLVGTAALGTLALVSWHQDTRR